MQRQFSRFSVTKKVSVQCVDRVGNFLVIGRGKWVIYLVIDIRQRAPKSVIVLDFHILLLCFVVYCRLKLEC
jgi:lipoate-protein ligase B